MTTNRDDLQESAADYANESAASLMLVADFVVTTPAEYEEAGDILQHVKGRAKAIQEKRDGAVGPIKKGIREIEGWFRGPLKELAQVEVRIKAAMSSFHKEREATRLRQLKEAQAAAKKGDTQKATALIMAEPEEAPEVKGIITRATWTYDLDESKLPREYFIVDKRRIAAEVRRLKDKTNIPGVTPVRETGISASSK